VNCSGDVCGSIEILTTRVAKVDFVSVDIEAGVDLWLVVDHSSVETDRRDGFKRGVDELISLRPELSQLVRSLTLSHFLSSNQLLVEP
jgi:hypothetical protein